MPSEEKLRAFAADRPFAGAWRGVVETYEKKIPVALTLKDGATVIWRIWLPASMTTPWDIDFPTPLRSSANAALNAAAITSGASIYLDAQGYTAP